MSLLKVKKITGFNNRIKAGYSGFIRGDWGRGRAEEERKRNTSLKFMLC